MEKFLKLISFALLLLALSGCVNTKDFKEAHKQANQCEEVGLDYKLSEEGVGYIRGVECIIKQ